MIDFMVENWHDFIFWSLYASFFMSMFFSLSCLWFNRVSWTTEYYDIHQTIFQPPKMMVANTAPNIVPMIVWLPKTIRRKESMGEDPDSQYFSMY